MIFITLNRPDVYTNRPIRNGNIERGLVTQLPVTINPEYIVSMVEHFNISKEFDFTELYLSDSTYYHVTSRIDEIVAMIKKEEKRSCSYAPVAEDKHDCCLWDFGRHECGIGIGDCPDSSACGFFD